MKPYLFVAFIMVGMGCSTPAETFEQAREATLAIQGAISKGVSFSQFGVLVENLSAEILKVKERAKSKEEQKIFLTYAAILESYEHSHRAWKLQVDLNKNDAEYSTTTGEGINRSFLIQSYWRQAAVEFRSLNENPS